MPASLLAHIVHAVRLLQSTQVVRGSMQQIQHRAVPAPHLLFDHDHQHHVPPVVRWAPRARRGSLLQVQHPMRARTHTVNHSIKNVHRRARHAARARHMPPAPVATSDRVALDDTRQRRSLGSASGARSRAPRAHTPRRQHESLSAAQ